MQDNLFDKLFNLLSENKEKLGLSISYKDNEIILQSQYEHYIKITQPNSKSLRFDFYNINNPTTDIFTDLRDILRNLEYNESELKNININVYTNLKSFKNLDKSESSRLERATLLDNIINISDGFKTFVDTEINVFNSDNKKTHSIFISNDYDKFKELSELKDILEREYTTIRYTPHYGFIEDFPIYSHDYLNIFNDNENGYYIYTNSEYEELNSFNILIDKLNENIIERINKYIKNEILNYKELVKNGSLNYTFYYSSESQQKFDRLKISDEHGSSFHNEFYAPSPDEDSNIVYFRNFMVNDEKSLFWLTKLSKKDKNTIPKESNVIFKIDKDINDIFDKYSVRGFLNSVLDSLFDPMFDYNLEAPSKVNIKYFDKNLISWNKENDKVVIQFDTEHINKLRPFLNKFLRSIFGIDMNFYIHSKDFFSKVDVIDSNKNLLFSVKNENNKAKVSDLLSFLRITEWHKEIINELCK